jgi:hypothetical protein
MSLWLLELPASGGKSQFDGVKAKIVEADSEALAKERAAADEEGDFPWASATGTEITAGFASDYTGWRYTAKVVHPTTRVVVNQAEYTGVASDTVDLIGAALALALRGDAISAAIAADAAVFTDETTEANEDTGDDMTLFPATPAEDDAYYFGFSVPLGHMILNITTAGAGTYTLTWEYWNGSAWSALTVGEDETGSFKNAGLGNINFTIPADWAANTVNSQGPFYFIRAVIDAGTTTTVPLAGQVWVGQGTIGSYSTPTLTAAAIADGVGDHALVVEAFPPNADLPYASAIGSITDQGVAAAVLTVALDIPTAIPEVLRSL